MKNGLILCCAAMMSVMGAYAQAPQLIAYQGKLLHSNVLVNAGVDIVGRLYSNAVGGAAGYANSNHVVVVDGVYTIYLGSNTTLGVLSDALRGGEAWLELEINGTVLPGRDRLVSVPYALQAEEQDPLWLTASTNCVHREGAVFLGAVTSPAFYGNGLGLTNIPEVAAQAQTLTNLQQNLILETQTRTAADVVLSAALHQVSTDLTTTSNSLQGQVSAVQTELAVQQIALVNEQNLRRGADRSLSNSVANLQVVDALHEAALAQLSTGKLDKVAWRLADATTNYVPRTGGAITGNLAVQGEVAWIQLPTNVPAPGPGALRFDDGALQVWDGTQWRKLAYQP